MSYRRKCATVPHALEWLSSLIHPLTRTATKSTTAPCTDRQPDAAECFDAYLEVLVGELVALHTFISTGKLNSEYT